MRILRTGSPRPKRLMHGKANRQRITMTLCSLGEVDIVGSKPHILVWVKSYCAGLRKEWSKVLRSSGITVAEEIGIGDADSFGHYRITVRRIVGMEAQLETVVMSKCVERWTYVVNGAVPMGEKCDEGGIPYVVKVTAQGGGEVKVKSSGKVKVGGGAKGGADEVASLKDAIAASYHTDRPRLKY